MKFLHFLQTHKKLWITIGAAAFVIGGTIFALRWARGYRPTLGKSGPTITGTGLLVASSDPKGAEVVINGKLTTATDDTLNLTPGDYTVEIKKDGYITWKKSIKIIAELVTQTSAKLFPAVPSLTPLTFTGVSDTTPSPDGQKIAYKVSSASAEPKRGLWILELADRNLTIARPSEPRQIARNTSQWNFETSHLIWSPDSSQVLAYWIQPNKKQSTKINTNKQTTTTITPQQKSLKNSINSQQNESENIITQAVLLEANKMNDAADLKDATTRLPVLLAQWHFELDQKDQERLKELPSAMQEIATSSATTVYFSPDEKRLMYGVIEETTIPDHLIPDLLSESTQPEQRQLKPGELYVYDLKEDRNYKVSDIKANQYSRPETIDAAEVKNMTPDKYWKYRQERLSIVEPEPVGEQKLWEDTTQSKSATGSASQTKRVASLPPVPEARLLAVLSGLEDRYSPIWKQPIQWFPTSAHLLIGEGKHINIREYDGQNNAVVYNGPVTDSFVYPWPNGTKLIIMTNLNDEETPSNLYAINLR